MADFPSAHHNPEVDELVSASNAKFGPGFSITTVPTGGHNNVTTVSAQNGQLFYKIDLEVC